MTSCSFVKRTLGNRKQSRFSNRLFPRVARNVPPEVVRPPPNQQQAPKANDRKKRNSPPLLPKKKRDLTR
ncbi:unnamed protein product [Lasius platythorax]|uniref:Uncharacterized protein n=1 Tax=Lasius platythorax TaxID=488582 RepID=A0AAV2PAK7_9HYME